MSEKGDDLESISVHSAASSRASRSTRKTDAEIDPETELDLINRDPNDINGHIETCFDDVIAEPEGAHSADCIWRNAFSCFRTGKGLCYKIVTFICAIPLAFCWGCQFACVTFSHIWFVTPCMRLFDMNFDCVRKFWSLCVHCMYDPCCEAYSLMFSRIRVRHWGSALEPLKGEPDDETPRRWERNTWGRQSGRSNKGFVHD